MITAVSSTKVAVIGNIKKMYCGQPAARLIQYYVVVEGTIVSLGAQTWSRDNVLDPQLSRSVELSRPTRSPSCRKTGNLSEEFVCTALHSPLQRPVLCLPGNCIQLLKGISAGPSVLHSLIVTVFDSRIARIDLGCLVISNVMWLWSQLKQPFLIWNGAEGHMQLRNQCKEKKSSRIKQISLRSTVTRLVEYIETISYNLYYSLC